MRVIKNASTVHIRPWADINKSNNTSINGTIISDLSCLAPPSIFDDGHDTPDLVGPNPMTGDAAKNKNNKDMN